MDDISLVSQSPDASQGDLGMTKQFGASVGFSDNVSQRQKWSDADPVPKQIEHLGVRCVPVDPSIHIVPRTKWEKVETGICILATVPGSSLVRIRLACAYIRPLWPWASPVVVPPPTTYAKQLATTRWRTSTTW
ncbi:unnamed protein product [Prorocentrum cordatum]|uniref:Uncharacterized protein n=1 Tax=Prorocentrum cordatum TaxID=2364126 RepID=A0ABN9U8Y6_9DINO|nr:unnamed protein product [Polarella glacialis]